MRSGRPTPPERRNAPRRRSPCFLAALIARPPGACYLEAVLFTGLLRAPPDTRRGWAAGLLASALVLHDLEEAAAYPALRPAIREILSFAPPVDAAWAALAAVTLAGVALALWAGRGPGSAAKTAWLRTIAVILLANVLVPHVPAAMVLGGYAPGVVTAVALNLPVSLLALMLLRPRDLD